MKMSISRLFANIENEVQAFSREVARTPPLNQNEKVTSFSKLQITNVHIVVNEGGRLDWLDKS
jgi:hypothetical protein